jgi:ferredoxin
MILYRICVTYFFCFDALHPKRTFSSKFHISRITFLLDMTFTYRLTLILVVVGGTLCFFTTGFIPTTISSNPSTTYSSSSLNGWMDAFKNDESLGKAENPGIKGGPKYNEQVTVNGIVVPGAVAGQKLTVVAGRVRVKIPVNCQKGDCGTCMVTLNGRKVKGMSIFLAGIEFDDTCYRRYLTASSHTLLIVKNHYNQHVKHRYPRRRLSSKPFKPFSHDMQLIIFFWI